MHERIKKIAYSMLCSSILVLNFGCGGGSSSNTVADDNPPETPPVTPPVNPPAPTVTTTSADVIDARGTPVSFNVECTRHAFDASTGNWEPQEGFVRVESWSYSTATGSDIISMLNGEVISQTSNTNDISQRPLPNIDPRRFGCSESIVTVNRVIDGVQVFTTEGTAIENELVLGGGIQIKSVLYDINSSQSTINITYSNDKMIGMVAL